MSDVTQTRVLMIVKNLFSNLPEEEMTRRYKERMDAFRALPGLIQKFYAHDPATGAWAGIYLWDSMESVEAYRDSELRKTIPSAYELTGPPEIEVFRIVDVLRPAEDETAS